ncbi:MAG: alpha/beta hydrolase [Pseudoruegeria sp.]
MPLHTINTQDGRLMRPDAIDLCAKDIGDILATSSGGPIIVMIHGYKFSPFAVKHDPHRHILAAHPDQDSFKAISWPKHLGGLSQTQDEALCIAFGWPARGSIWSAYREATIAGGALSKLISMLKDQTKRPIDVIAHSLGARVFLEATRIALESSVERAVLMTGAELRQQTLLALQSEAGKSVQVLNIISRENDLYDWMLETALDPLNLQSRSLGHGLEGQVPNWLDLQLDHPDVIAGLGRIGFPISTSNRRICHWSSYLRPGAFPLYRAFFSERTRVSLDNLRPQLPQTLTPRWSRLMAVRLPQLPRTTPALRP